MQLKDSYDVIVVGAGPAGSSTAEACAKQGLDVLVLERNQEVGVPKRCGEGLSHNAVMRLKLDLPKKCIAQEINCAIVYAPNMKRIDIKFEGTEGYILERKIFDKWLAYNAARAGANILTKAFVHGVIKSDGFVKGVAATIMDEEREIRSKIVVAADGAESLIARKAGLRTNKKLNLVDSGLQYEMGNIKLENPKRIELYFGNNIAKRGYVWIFPKGKDIANVGVGIVPGSGKTAKQYLDAFIESCDELRNGSIIEVNGGCVPVGGLMKNMVANGLVCVGDSANQVNPIHGGGIAESISAGRIAGDVIARAIDANDFSARFLEKYNKIWWKERGEKLQRVEKVREAFEKMSDGQLNDLIDVLSGEDLVAFTRGNNLLKLARVMIKYNMKGIARAVGLG